MLAAEDNGGVSFENGMKVIHAILPDGTAVKGPWPSHSDNDRPCLIMHFGAPTSSTNTPHPRYVASGLSILDCPACCLSVSGCCSGVEVFRQVYDILGLGWVYAGTTPRHNPSTLTDMPAAPPCPQVICQLLRRIAGLAAPWSP